MIFEYYEKYMAESLRIYSYFGITFLFLFLGARSIYFKHYWECVTHLATALFFVLLFMVIIVKDGILTNYVFTPYLFVWLVFTLIFFYNTIVRDNSELTRIIKNYIYYIKSYIKR